MTWFDFISLAVLFYFVIRGFFRGLLRALFPLVGMVVAFLYSGWFALKLQGFVAKFVSHPKAQFFLSLFLAFFIIYFTFVLAGFLLFAMLKSLNLSIADRILGSLLGFVKGTLLITFLYLLFLLTMPGEKATFERSLTYPLVSRTLNMMKGLLPKDFVEFIQKTRKLHELPREFQPNLK
jgi:membrane protein required for colicin V production